MIGEPNGRGSWSYERDRVNVCFSFVCAIVGRLGRGGCWVHEELVERQKRQGSGESPGGMTREVWGEGVKRGEEGGCRIGMCE